MNTKTSNTICRYCREETGSGQRVIRCDKCGSIHHEDCWVKMGGCSTRGCSGKPMKPVVTESTQRTIQKMFGISYVDDAVGKLCPYCQTTIEKNEHAMICGRCGMPHHLVCYQQNGGCTTYGCVPQRLRRRIDDIPMSHMDLSQLDFKKRSKQNLNRKPQDEEVTATGIGSLGGIIVGIGFGLLIGAGWFSILSAFIGLLIGGAIGNVIDSKR